jgi:phosphoglycolate phosphatase
MSSVPDGLKAAIFDFDFTLGDSSRAVVHCVNQAVTEMGLRPVDPEDVTRTIGLTLETALEKLLGISDPVVQAEFKTRFVRAADDVMVAGTELLEGVLPALDSIGGNGVRLGIVSTKYRYRIEDILDRFGERHRFSVIVGGDDVKAHKPDPEGLSLALSTLGIPGTEALYVGDHLVDALAAAGAGIPFVGVLTGNTDAEEFRTKPGVGVVDGVRNLPSFLSRLPHWPPPSQ